MFKVIYQHNGCLGGFESFRDETSARRFFDGIIERDRNANSLVSIVMKKGNSIIASKGIT